MPAPVPPPKPPRAARLSARYQRVSNGRARSFLRRPATPISHAPCSSPPLDALYPRSFLSPPLDATGVQSSFPSSSPDCAGDRDSLALFTADDVDNKDYFPVFSADSASDLLRLVLAPLESASEREWVSLPHDDTNLRDSSYVLPAADVSDGDGMPWVVGDVIDRGGPASSPGGDTIDRSDLISVPVDGDVATTDVDVDPDLFGDVFKNWMTDADSDWDTDSAMERITGSWMTLEEVCDPDPDEDLFESSMNKRKVSEPIASVNPYLCFDPAYSENCNLLCNLIDPDPNSCYSDSSDQSSSEKICDLDPDPRPKPESDLDTTTNPKYVPDPSSWLSDHRKILENVPVPDCEDGSNECKGDSPSDDTTDPDPSPFSHPSKTLSILREICDPKTDPDFINDPPRSETMLQEIIPILLQNLFDHCGELSTNWTNLSQVFFDPDPHLYPRCLFTSVQSQLYPVHPVSSEMLLVWRFFNPTTHQNRQDWQDWQDWQDRQDRQDRQVALNDYY